jgi:hypothetical protein
MKKDIKPKIYCWKVNWGSWTVEVEAAGPEDALRAALRKQDHDIAKKYILVSKDEDPKKCALLRCHAIYTFKEDYRWAFTEYSVWLDGRKHGMI